MQAERTGDYGAGGYERNLFDFIERLSPDFISLNVFDRRPGIESNHRALARVELLSDRYGEMADRINRSFYFHPKTILRQLLSLKSPKQLYLALESAMTVLHPS